MILNRIKSIALLMFLFSLFACNYNSSRMLKTPKDYKFDAPPEDNKYQYVLSISDIIEFNLYTNDGTTLIDLTAISESQKSVAVKAGTQYLIEFDGFVKLPIIGRTELKGKTIKEAEKYLEEVYSKYYIKPFITLKVMNRRIIIFPGRSNGSISKGKIIPLKNENTTLMEALASAGGLVTLSKAKNIKLIRGELKNPQVFLFDLSTIEGLKQTDFVLQANDIIYVDSRSDYFRNIMRDITPVLSLITSAVTLIVVINNLK